MELKMYLMQMVRQECDALKSATECYDGVGCHTSVMSVFRRLSGFVHDYDEYIKTGNITERKVVK